MQVGARTKHNKRIGNIYFPIIFCISLCIAIAIGEKLLEVYPQYTNLRYEMRQMLPTTEDNYPAYFGNSANHHTVDHFVIWNNLNNWVEEARKADIIFSGNSRTLFAFHKETLETLSKSLGLKFYNLGFQCAEGFGFTNAVLRKFNLSPKMLVINSDEYFPRGPSDFAENVMSQNWWNGWKTVFEDTIYFNIMRRLHKTLPQWVKSDNGAMIYRNKSDGWWVYGFQINTARQKTVYSEDRVYPVPIREFTLQRAIKFKKFLDKNNTQLVFTWLMIPEVGNVHEPLGISKLLNVPFIKVDHKNISTFDMSHMDYDSAKLYSERFYKKLKETKEFKEIFLNSIKK